jgi:Holliday junction resolvase RusA-like endonuclease
MQGAGKVTFPVGDLECRIRLSPKSRIDVDNVKALPDLAQRMGVIKNDRQIRRMIIDARTEVEKGRCEISLGPIT